MLRVKNIFIYIFLVEEILYFANEIDYIFLFFVCGCTVAMCSV